MVVTGGSRGIGAATSRLGAARGYRIAVGFHANGAESEAYAAAKAGINAFTIGVARELAEEGIRINAVSPGVIDTDQYVGLNPERKKGLLESIPLKRMGQAEEVAEAILWLLSAQASYVTGSILAVNGGR